MVEGPRAFHSIKCRTCNNHMCSRINMSRIIRLPRRRVLACMFTIAFLVWLRMIFHQNHHQRMDLEAVTIKWNATTTYYSQQEDKKDIVFLTYLDRVVRGLCLGMESAALNGLELGVLGIGMERKFEFLKRISNVKTRKLFAFHLALTDPELREEYGITNDTVVSLCDGTDVLYLKPADYVLEKFKELERASLEQPGLILVGAERNCWPYMRGRKELVRGGKETCSRFPDVNSTFKYLNSGSLMGRAPNLAAMLQDVIESMQSINDDDQECLQKAYLKQIEEGNVGPTDYRIVLDARQEVFQLASLTNLQSRHHSRYEAEGAYYDKVAGQVVNTEHNVLPAISHSNGKKRFFLPIAKQYVKFHSKDPLRSAVRDVIRERHGAHYPWFGKECMRELKALGLN